MLNTHKRRRSKEPLVPASVGRPIAAVPISEHPPLFEDLPPPSAAYLESHAVACAETTHGRPYFGSNPEKVTRVRRTNPDCLPMVLDFLAVNLPREACDIPHYVNRDLHNLPRAWTTDLDEVARRRSPDAAQALFAPALQAATMASQVARDSELTGLEKNLAEAVKEAERSKAELVEARQSSEVALKEAADREKADNQKVAVAEGQTVRATEDLAAKAVELDGVAHELVDFKGKIEETKLDPYSNVAQTSEFAYYMVYADAIRMAKGSGLDVGPLVEAFKAYVLVHPLNPTFVLPILDLSMEHGVDLSWYPQPDSLADPAALMNTTQGDSVPEDVGAEADPFSVFCIFTFYAIGLRVIDFCNFSE
ncbi:hypothetical protein OROMI_009522 [Orobanche minor]